MIFTVLYREKFWILPFFSPAFSGGKKSLIFFKKIKNPYQKKTKSENLNKIVLNTKNFNVKIVKKNIIVLKKYL